MILEVSTALIRATKYDLFTGDVDDLSSVQAIKENTTVFFLDEKTKEISGPHELHSYHDFVRVYHKMVFGLIGIITPFPNVITNEFIFHLVLREASTEDLKDTPRHIKKNRLYYTYAEKKLLGPFYTDNSTTSLYLENLIAKKEIFVPNEKQHFKNKSLQKAS